jgi:MFS transporter, DHA2 family, methylenomycin A resistance protein
MAAYPSDEARASAVGWPPLVAICLGYFMVILDTNVVNVALPALVSGLHTTTTGSQWVADAYTLTFAALLLSAGALGDRRGAKAVFQAGLSVFVVCSLACALAPSIGVAHRGKGHAGRRRRPAGAVLPGTS